MECGWYGSACRTAVPASLEKSVKLFVVVPYFVPDVGVKVKLLEFKSPQVITAAILSEKSVCSK